MRMSNIPLSETTRTKGSILEQTDQIVPITSKVMGISGLAWRGFINIQNVIRGVLSRTIPEIDLPTPIEVSKGYYSRESAPSEEEIAVKYILDTMKGTMDLPKSIYYFRRKLWDDAPYDVTIPSAVSNQLVVYSFSETADDMNNQAEIMKELFNKIFKQIHTPFIFVPRSKLEELSSESIMSIYPKGEERLLYYPAKNIWEDQNILCFEEEFLSFDDKETILKKHGIIGGMSSCEEHNALKIGEFISWGRVKTRYRRFHFQDVHAPFYVGKYIIDLTRVMDAMIYHNTGNSGFVWPYEIAPYKLHLLYCSQSRREMTEYIYKELCDNGFSVLYDDRQIPYKEQFEMARLLGIPNIIAKDTRCRHDDGTLFLIDRKTWDEKFTNYLRLLETPYRYM